MENVGAVLVYMDSFHILTIYITADVVPFFHHQACLTVLLCIPGKHACVQSASDQYIIVMLHSGFSSLRPLLSARCMSDKACLLRGLFSQLYYVLAKM